MNKIIKVFDIILIRNNAAPNWRKKTICIPHWIVFQTVVSFFFKKKKNKGVEYIYTSEKTAKAWSFSITPVKKITVGKWKSPFCWFFSSDLTGHKSETSKRIWFSKVPLAENFYCDEKNIVWYHIIIYFLSILYIY